MAITNNSADQSEGRVIGHALSLNRVGGPDREIYGPRS